MKIECVKEKLQRAVSFAEHATGKRLPLPILGKILLAVTEKGLSIRATNLDLGIEIFISAKTSKHGAVAVSGNLLENYLTNLPQQTNVNIELVGNNLVCTTNNSSVLIATEKSDDFPNLPEFSVKEEINHITIESSELLAGIRSVVFAASVSDIKPELAGVLMSFDGEDLIFTSTDSFRLAEKRVGRKKANPTQGIIIPARNIHELIRIISDSNGSVDIKYTKNQISFKGTDWHLTSRLVDGNFPSYTHLIPKSFSTHLVVPKEALQNALRITNIFTDRFHQITLRVIPDDNLFEVLTKNQEVGESTVRVEATVEGEPVDVNLNGRYLLDCFQVIDKESLILGLNGRDKAALVRAVGDRTFSYLVMPLNK